MSWPIASEAQPTDLLQQGGTARLEDQAHWWTCQCLRTELGLPNRKCLKNSLLKAFPVHFPKKFSPRMSLSSCMTATPGCDGSPRAGSHKSQAARGGFLHLLSRLRCHKPMSSHLLYVEEGSLRSGDSWFILTSEKSQKPWPFTLGCAHLYS